MELARVARSSVTRKIYLRPVKGLAIGAIAALALIAVNVCGQAPNSAQQGASPKQGLAYPVRLFQIDAVVTDKEGQYVKGLGPQNFVLTEEGRPQKLTLVEHYVAGAVHGAADAPVVIDLKTAQNPEKLRPVAHDHRMIVLFFDFTTMTHDEVERSSAAATKFVSEDVTSVDLIAVISFGPQFKVVADFTNNRGLLKNALYTLAPGKDADLHAEVSTDEGETEDETEFNIFTTDNKLYAIKGLAEHIGAIPGRKSVIDFSGGLKKTGEENASALKAVINAANMDVVSLYEVDMSDSTAPGNGEPVMEDPGDPAKFAAAQESRKMLGDLAHDTGGRLFTDVKDFAPIFKQVQDDSQDYYLLSYYSTNTRHDGLFRKVSVKLEKVRGAQVKFRAGYYGSLDAAFTKPPRY
jgi:VWFA-related protein